MRGSRRGRGQGMGAGKGMERTLAARTSDWGGSGGRGVTRKVCEGLGRWGRSGAAELARVCGGGRRLCSEPEESGERRGWGGAEGGRSCSRDPPSLPSPVPFHGSHGTPPSTPGRPHRVPVASPQSVPSRAAWHLAQSSAAAAPSFSTLVCSSSSASRSVSVSSPRRPSKQPLALGCSVFLFAPLFQRLSLLTILAEHPAGDP